MSGLLRLSEKDRLERLVARCGSALHLVPDYLLLAKNMLVNHPPAHQAYIMDMELDLSVDWLHEESLMTALQAGRAAAAAVQCRHCQPSKPLTVRYANFSGSSAECLYDLVIGEGGTSDYDVMFEFGGPVRWAAEAGAGCISPESAPQLCAKPSSSPGFVTLYWARTSRCSHEAPLAALPADSIRRLMWDFCRANSSDDAELTRSGPAVNVKESDDDNGGLDHVPCLRLQWWPETEAFLSRHRETDFPPAEARKDICRFGVHVVPTGRPGSTTEHSDYRVSFSRAEVVTVRHLSPVQHATITTVKGMKNTMKDSGEAPALKSYYIKTSVLWLAQDQPSECWTGITAGVNMVLDWLEHRLNAGNIPCFFWPAINLVGGLEAAKLKDIITTVHQMKRESSILLMTCCERLGLGLDTMLEDGSEPLSEPQLRLRLAQRLVRQAVLEGIGWRPTAPCWEYWSRNYIPALPRLSQHRLLQWLHRRQSGTYYQQCYLLLALSVAPADQVSEMRLTSLGGDVFSWPVTPLLNLLTESDMEFLLGEPAAVSAWCHQQLCRPPAERPTGLTAELDTPQGRVELLLQPELFLRALSEAVPGKRDWWQGDDQMKAEQWRANFVPRDTYQQCRQWLEECFSCQLEYSLRDDLPELDGPTAAATARLWRQYAQRLLSGDRLLEAYTAVTTRWPDRWQLLQYLLTTDTSEGNTRRRRRSLLTHRHTHRSHALYAQGGHKVRQLQ